MPVQPVTPQRIRELKRLAKQMSRSTADKTYMQCLDIVCREQMGLRHFHEAQKLAGKAVPCNSAPADAGLKVPLTTSDFSWTEYLQACQDAYFEI